MTRVSGDVVYTPRQEGCCPEGHECHGSHEHSLGERFTADASPSGATNWASGQLPLGQGRVGPVARRCWPQTLRLGTIVLVDRTVLLVDAGHLLSGGGSLTVSEHRRANLEVDVCKLATALVARVEKDAGLPLLRTYWYDGAREGQLSAEHAALRQLDYTKLRLGRLVQGKQKGVDALIYRDLTTLARQHSIVTAYLVAGDEDLCEGVAEAQSLGVQVVLLPVEPAGVSDVSQALIHEADRVIDLDTDFLGSFFALRGPIVASLRTPPAEPAQD